MENSDQTKLKHFMIEFFYVMLNELNGISKSQFPYLYNGDGNISSLLGL